MIINKTFLKFMAHDEDEFEVTIDQDGDIVIKDSEEVFQLTLTATEAIELSDVLAKLAKYE